LCGGDRWVLSWWIIDGDDCGKWQVGLDEAVLNWVIDFGTVVMGSCDALKLMDRIGTGCGWVDDEAWL
jgi:hypothetical protein